MTVAYDKEYRTLAKATAEELNIPLATRRLCLAHRSQL